MMMVVLRACMLQTKCLTNGANPVMAEVRSCVTASTSLSKSYLLKRYHDYRTGVGGKAAEPQSEETQPVFAVRLVCVEVPGPLGYNTCRRADEAIHLQQVTERSQLRH
ncbi:unnamed protein product, partial [Ectocarpus sp. 6 AP-2014]